MITKIITLELGAFGTNAYVFNNGTHTAVIDPAIASRNLRETVAMFKCGLEYILLTHAHFDHIGGISDLKSEFPDAKLVINVGDEEVLRTQTGRDYPFGFFIKPEQHEPDTVVCDGDFLPFGDDQIKVLHTPGHSPGSCCYQLGKTLFCGDTIFRDGVGRTDLRGGNLDELMQSISRLTLLPDDVALLPGHGPSTTVGEERKNNPYLPW
ncbi:MAG TPA: MBL fold metallo-hydrolase [Oscillospiraceae bacterium]|nr:MBL fold metallo-hydrolase [Oscillospiraceae bacterium]HPS35267.1 MBL fold metallo-hydrolase [Oscillospiraceae bacterium]